MKKRLLAIALAGMMSVGALAGCGSSSSSDTTDAGSATASTSGETYNISMIVKLTDGHFNKVMAGAQAYADENPNVNLEILSPTSATDYDGQINMLETSLSTDSVDGVIIAPLQSDSVAQLVSGTSKAVVALDTDFEADEKSTFVGTGNYEAGLAGGEAAAQMAIDNGSESPTAVILTGVQGDETHEDRLAGYTEGFESLGGEIVDLQYCDANADKAANAMEAIIQKFPDGVDCVLATCDDMAMAAAKVIQDSGGDVFASTLVCGFDGNQASLEAVQDGSVAMDVAQQGYQMGYLSVEAVVNVLEGNSVDSFIDSGFEIVNSDNVEDYIQQMKDIGVWDED